MNTMNEQLEMISKSSLPVLILWGTLDDAVPYEGSALITSILKEQATLITLDSHFHDFPIEFGEMTADIITEWYERG